MSLFEISVEHRFTAYHAVKLPNGCFEPKHEHAWQVTAAFRSDKLDGMGMVCDFTDVQEAMKKATADLEGADLNALPQTFDTGTSAEALAKLLCDRLAKKFGGRLYRVRVIETPGCSAAYYPNGA